MVTTDKSNTNKLHSGKTSKLLDSQFFHKYSIYGKSVLPTSDSFY